MIKFDVKKSIELNRLIDDIPNRIDNARRAIGQEIADKIENEVSRRIPTNSVWMRIYKNAITYKETLNSFRWAVAGYADVPYGHLPAAETLIIFSGISQLGQILKPYNPWTVDTIPPVIGGYREAIVARPATESSVNNERNRLLIVLSIVNDALINAGASIDAQGSSPEINGKVYADLIFMAEKLETGGAGFSRVPHWSTAANKVETSMETWIKSRQIVDNVNDALLGASFAPTNIMSEAEADFLERIRDLAQ